MKLVHCLCMNTKNWTKIITFWHEGELKLKLICLNWTVDKTVIFFWVTWSKDSSVTHCHCRLQSRSGFCGVWWGTWFGGDWRSHTVPLAKKCYLCDVSASAALLPFITTQVCIYLCSRCSTLYNCKMLVAVKMFVQQLLSRFVALGDEC